jgi:dTDP-4-amino-4,6-dideoxygalactose transaminase
MPASDLYVTKTALPPLEEYVAYLEQIWSEGRVANHGPLVSELEKRLEDALAVRHFWLVANGTLALQIAIRSLDLRGEIITTPFSYVATASAIVWERATPVFVDIEPQTLTIDADRIEDAITEKTTAILATHVYGFPCDVGRIASIAERHGLKVVYDAAHAFGVRYHGRPLAAFGDVSTLSFHATKLFHTVEGGGLATADEELAHRMAYMRNFGHHGQEEFWGLGINAKSSELHAAMGLCLLPRVSDIIAARRERVDLYRQVLDTTGIVTWSLPSEVAWNYGFFPVIFDSEWRLLEVREALAEDGIHPRRYFYPALTVLPYIDSAPMPVAESLSPRILCLPLHEGLALDDVRRVAAIVSRALTRR